MTNKRKIAGFKKFSDIKKESKIEEIYPSMPIHPDRDSDTPMNPNLPDGSRKIEKPASRKNLMPQDQDLNLSNDEEGDKKENESNVEKFGKVAKFPKNTKASKAYNFLENVKVPKNSIWYIMVEKQDNELQMVKYNYKEGVDLGKFVNELKSYYIEKYKDDVKLKKLVESIYVDGSDKYSMVKNIPLINVGGKKMITIITQDLIKLLSK